MWDILDYGDFVYVIAKYSHNSSIFTKLCFFLCSVTQMKYQIEIQGKIYSNYPIISIKIYICLPLFWFLLTIFLKCGTREYFQGELTCLREMAFGRCQHFPIKVVGPKLYITMELIYYCPTNSLFERITGNNNFITLCTPQEIDFLQYLAYTYLLAYNQYVAMGESKLLSTRWNPSICF